MYPVYPIIFVPMFFGVSKYLSIWIDNIVTKFSEISFEFYILQFYFINGSFIKIFGTGFGLLTQIIIGFSAILFVAAILAKTENVIGKAIDAYFELDKQTNSGTKYMMGKVVRPTTPNNYTYLAINGGITGTLEPSWNTTVDGETTDGTIVWECFHETRPLCDGLYSNDFDSNFAILWIGSNDILKNNEQVKDVENAIQAWHIARKAVGWKTITYTILPRTEKKVFPMTDPIFESRRAEINLWIRSTYQHWSDGLVDVAADSRLQDPNDTTYFSPDKIHPCGKGLEVVIYLTCKTIEEIVDISNRGNNNVSNLNKSNLYV